MLTGTFSQPREAIKVELIGVGVKCADKITSGDQWLWVGDKPGASKVKDAERLDAQISSPQDLIALYLAKMGQKSTPSPWP